MLAYRRDIDGLRAVAVTAVVGYHAGVSGLAGGFVGVDVFFVVSGYLITAIIDADLRRGTFSLPSFYERRVRRIFPALFAMLAMSSLAASCILLPGELAGYGRSVVAATLFVSNVFFHFTSDYFAGAAHLKPMLHTWSLSVEEQYYLVFPPAMWMIARWGGRRWLAWLLPVLLISLLASIWGATARPQATFYLAPTRAWELLIGALLALGAVPQVRSAALRDVLGLSGLAMIGAAVAFYSEATVFPGAAAVLPCLGAALVLHTGQNTGPSRVTSAARMLGWTPIVGIGLISYSLYLWHWPVLVFARHLTGGSLGTLETAVAVLAALAMATLSWRYVEQPFRGATRRVAQPQLFAGAIAAMALAIAGGAAASLSGGWPARFPGYNPPEIAGRDALDEGRCFLRTEQQASAHPGWLGCRKGAAGGTTVVVWGDSFAAHLMAGLTSRSGDLAMVQLTASACPPIAQLVHPRRRNCEAFARMALAAIEAGRPALVVLAARWESHLGRHVSMPDLQATVARLRRAGIAVVLVGQSPSFDFASPYDVVYRTGRAMARINFDPALNRQIAGIEGASVLDPLPSFCSRSLCRLMDGPEYLYFDGGHFSAAGSSRMAEALMPVIRDALGRHLPPLSTAQHDVPGRTPTATSP